MVYGLTDGQLLAHARTDDPALLGTTELKQRRLHGGRDARVHIHVRMAVAICVWHASHLAVGLNERQGACPTRTLARPAAAMPGKRRARVSTHIPTCKWYARSTTHPRIHTT
jgi:hypothetical protein